MAEESSAPMLHCSNSQDKRSDAASSSDISPLWRRFVRLSRHLATPTGQLCLAYLVFVLCPGLYWNIFSTLPSFQATLGSAFAYTPLDVVRTEYALPSVVGFFSGLLLNKLGSRYTLLAGCVGYPLRIAAYLCYDYTYNIGFIAFAGILLTFCQGLSGSVVPYLMLVCSTRDSRGRAIAWFLGIWSSCALVGASIVLSSTNKSTDVGYFESYHTLVLPHGVRYDRPNSMLYAPFLILAVLGACLCWMIVGVRPNRTSSMPGRIAREAGTWSDLMLALWRDVFANPYMLSLLPMFFVSTWFYGYQFAKANNNIQFTQRAQAMNLVLYWAMSIVGSIALGEALDTVRLKRKTRARLAWLALLVLTISIWSGGSEFQAENDSYVNDFLIDDRKGGPLDPGRASYWGPAVLFLFYGLHSATWQVASYWIIGSLTDDDQRLANYAGAYNAAQSAGNAVIWRLVSPGAYVVGFAYPSTRSVFDAVWALAIASLLIAAPTFFLAVRDVTRPDQPHSGPWQTVEGESQAKPPSAEDVAIETTTAAVALPQGVAARTRIASRPVLSRIGACTINTLVVVIVLLPIGLASFGTLVNTGGFDGCLPDGTFAIPGNFNIWNFQYILTLTVGFGRMSFAIAKFVDLCWDVIVGHGGQAILVWTAYKVLTWYLVCLMEHDGVTMRTYTAVAFHTGSLKGAWALMRDLTKRRALAIRQNLAIMLFASVYLLIFPVVTSAMTSYAPIGNAYVTLEINSTDGPTTKNLPFSEFTLINRTDGTWAYDNITNLTTAALQEKAFCTQTNYYRWGFSYLMLFILAVASSVFAVLLVLLKQHDGLVSSVDQADCYTPGLWRSVMELSSHARSVTQGEDAEHLRTEELEQRLSDTHMAFDKEDLGAVKCALAAVEETSDVIDYAAAGQADGKEKPGLPRRAGAVWRRRKQWKGFHMYGSLPAQYEGV